MEDASPVQMVIEEEEDKEENSIAQIKEDGDEKPAS